MYLKRYLDKKVMMVLSGCPPLIGTLKRKRIESRYLYMLEDLEQGPEAYSELEIDEKFIIAMGCKDVIWEEDEYE